MRQQSRKSSFLYSQATWCADQSWELLAIWDDGYILLCFTV